MTDEEIRTLAWTLLGEAGGEGAEGMEAVAHVIRNRALSGRYPSNPAAVALQHNGSGYYQFSTWNAQDKGGNLPRSQYAPGTNHFAIAQGIVERIFSATPGRDPTQGATHYYAHSTMDEPYWWSSEAPKGGKKIGNHTYAAKYDYKDAPTPAERSMTREIGYFPVGDELTVFRSGVPIPLKRIGPDNRSPTPVTQSLSMQVQRENAGVTPRVIDTFVYDPVTNRLTSITDSRQLERERETKTAKQIQNEAKLRVSQSYAGQEGTTAQTKQMNKETVNAVRAASLMTTQSYAGQEGVKSATTTVKLASDGKKLQAQEQAAERRRAQAAGKQTQFAPVYQPAGSVNDNKDQERLAAGQAGMKLAGSTGRAANPLSRDSVAQKSAGAHAASIYGTTTLPPVTHKPVVNTQVVKTATPKPAGEGNGPLRVVVEDPNVVQVIRSAPQLATNGYVYQDGKQVGTIRPAGMTPSQQYDAINAASAERARERAGMGADTRSDWFKEATGG